MNHEEINLLLEEYITDSLDVDTALEVEAHLSSCTECSEYLFSLRLLRDKLSALPDKIEPDHDLWNKVFTDIHDVKKSEATTKPIVVRDLGTSKLKTGKKEVKEKEKKELDFHKDLKKKSRFKKKLSIILVAVVLLITAGIIYFYMEHLKDLWEIKSVSGIPLLNGEQILTGDVFEDGNLLNTDNAAQTEINIPKTGKVIAYKNSLIKKIPNKPAVELQQGTIQVNISAAVTNFQVFIPGAEINEFNQSSIFKVTVDSGHSLVEGITSWIKISGAGREVFLPADYYCPVDAGAGPGIPYFVNASQSVVKSMQSFLNNSGTQADLENIETSAKEYDVVSLWHLFQIVPEEWRINIFNLIDKFVPPPTGSSQDGLLALNDEMLMLWLKDIQAKY